jgi:hypothetical protein
VLLPEAAVQGWQQEQGRELTGTERYALAKMSLFQAFDERSEPGMMRDPVEIRAADAAVILQQLGI